MLFRLVENLYEKFNNHYNLEDHYYRHIVLNKEYDWTMDEYEKNAEILMYTPVDNRTIFGYVQDRPNNPLCKYNKETELFVSYFIDRHGIPRTITAFRRDWRTYTSQKCKEYWDELPA